MNNLEIKKIFKEYTNLEILKSFLTALLFFLILSAILLIPVIQIMFLYVPFMQYFLIGIYISMSLFSVYFNKLFVDTLKTYSIKETINYDTFKVRSSTVMTFLIFITVFIIYIVLT